MPKRLEGKVAIVTGAGRGIGRGEALLLAKEGAKVMVNDIGGGFDGKGEHHGPADEITREIREFGREAVRARTRKEAHVNFERNVSGCVLQLVFCL